MFTVTLLPAREGDCLWIEYGTSARPSRILIDGGRQATYEELRALALTLPQDQRVFELLVITHVDRDHIEGILALMGDPEPLLSFKDIWFNSYDHLHAANSLENLGAEMGETLVAWLSEADVPWNQAFGGKPIYVPDSGPLPFHVLDGGMRLTLLSPSAEKLKRLIPVWEKECREAGILPGDGYEIVKSPQSGIESLGTYDVDALADTRFEGDTAAANGSSIAFIAEFEGKRVLFGADVHSDLLEVNIERLSGGKPMVLDLFKVSHHGSENNLSRSLLERISCSRYAISTNGAYFRHPSASAIARTIKYGKAKDLHFNYTSAFTTIWNRDTLKRKHGYTPHYPPGTDGTIPIEL